MPPSGSNGSDTNFGPIAIKGSGHETATMVNGETVHQAGATSSSRTIYQHLLSATASQPTITVSFPLAKKTARQPILHFQIKALHSLQQRKSAVCSCRCKYQRIGNKITLALGTIPSTESSQSWTGQQGLWKVLGGLFKGHSSKRIFVFL